MNGGNQTPPNKSVPCSDYTMEKQTTLSSYASIYDSTPEFDGINQLIHSEVAKD